MSAGAGPPRRNGDDRPADEPTFTDMLDAFNLGGRRHRHKMDSSGDRRVPTVPDSAENVVPPSGEFHEAEENASIVRAYAWTGGRTKSDFQLEIETLVTTDERTYQIIGSLRVEHQAIARLCRQSKSVAEVGALLSLPLGVIRVLLGDMASNGWIIVHQTTSADDRGPDLELLQRVRNGLVRLGRV